MSFHWHKELKNAQKGLEKTDLYFFLPTPRNLEGVYLLRPQTHVVFFT